MNTTPNDTSTPIGVEAELYRLIDAFDAARKEFTKRLDAEGAAELALKNAERRAEFSDESPVVGTVRPGNQTIRTTVRQREMWVQGQVAPQWEAWRVAHAARMAAG